MSVIPPRPEPILAGDVAALARTLSLLERGEPAGSELERAVQGRGGGARRVVLTGPPGAGKSTLLGAVVQRLRGEGERAAILACDPVSPHTGGAFLGDRVRWAALSDDPGVFIRSVAARSTHEATRDLIESMVDVVAAAGWPWVFVETVGTGQSGFPHVRGATLVLVLSPFSGDEIQMLKAGVLESAAIHAVNKVDLPGGRRWAERLEEVLATGGGSPCVVPVSAATREGIETLIGALRGRAATALDPGGTHDGRD